MAQELVMEIKQKSTEKGVAAQYDKTVPIGVLAENVLFEDGSNLTDNLNVYVFQDKSDQGYSSLIESDSLQTITHTFKGTYFPSFEQLQRFFINKTCILKSYLGSNQFQLFLLDFVNVPYDNGIRLVSSPVKSKLPSAQLFNLQVWITLDIPAASDTIECTYTFVKYTVTHTAPGEMTQNQYRSLFNKTQQGNYNTDNVQKFWSTGKDGSADGVPGWRRMDYKAATNFPSTSYLNPVGEIPEYDLDVNPIAQNTSIDGLIPYCNLIERKAHEGSYVLRSTGKWSRNILTMKLAEYTMQSHGQNPEGLGTTLRLQRTDSNNSSIVLRDYLSATDFSMILFLYKISSTSIINTLIVPSGWIGRYNPSSQQFTRGNVLYLINPINQQYFKIQADEQYNTSPSTYLKISFDSGHIPNAGHSLTVYGLY